jgi:uncharacterized protein YjbJ (UPF0337 family)
MSLGDKLDNKAEELGGKAKVAAGDATDDQSLKAEGQADQGKANLKQAGEKLGDAAGDIKNSLTGGKDNGSQV